MRRRHSPIALSVLLLGATSLLAVQEASADQDAEVQQWSAPQFWRPDSAPASSKRVEAGYGGKVVSAVLTDPMPYVAITPCRLIDTRTTGGFLVSVPGYDWNSKLTPALDTTPTSADMSYQVTGAAHCTIPANARAISANYTVVGFSVNGRINAYPDDAATRPVVSTLNYRLPSVTVNNYAITPLSAAGKMRIFTSQTTDLTVDVNGYYAPVESSSPVSDMVETWEVSSGVTTFGDLATAGPTVSVTVPASGKVLVTLSAGIGPSLNNIGWMGFEVSGSTLLVPSVAKSLVFEGAIVRTSWTILLAGLNPGQTTFTAKYRGSNLSGTVNFDNRQIIVTPVP